MSTVSSKYVFLFSLIAQCCHFNGVIAWNHGQFDSARFCKDRLPILCTGSRPAQITSLSNPIVKRLVRLREKSQYRDEEASALIVGSKPVLELCESGPSAQKLKTLMLLDEDGEDWHQKFIMNVKCAEAQIFIVNSQVMKKITGLESAEKRISVAEFALPPPGRLKNLQRVLVLDRIQDPGNMGTILRTACGLGWHGVFLLDGCCDPFNDKALRAARGAAWSMEMVQGDWESLKQNFQAASPEGGMLVADIGGERPDTLRVGPSDKQWLLLSNDVPSLHYNRVKTVLILTGSGHILVWANAQIQGSGLSEESQRMLAAAGGGAGGGRGSWRRVGIELSASTESLNVAVAGAILMYALR